MFDHTNTLTVELARITVRSGRRLSASQPVLNAVTVLSQAEPVVAVRFIRRQGLRVSPDLSAAQIRHALGVLVEAGEVQRLGQGRYALCGTAGSSTAEQSGAGLPAPAVLRLVAADLRGQCCLDDVYAQAQAIESACTETALRMAITAAIREPEPHIVRVRRGVYRTVRQDSA